jgi:hypothetical protein
MSNGAARSDSEEEEDEDEGPLTLQDSYDEQ